MIKALKNTGIGNSKNVLRYIFGPGTLKELDGLISKQTKLETDYTVFFVDSFFEKDSALLQGVQISSRDRVIYVDTGNEPTTDYVDQLTQSLSQNSDTIPCAIVGVGGGATLDIAKAVANLLTNQGKAEDYQGWDLVKNPGVYKIGIPTLSGTGAEATRTCVMTNPKSGLKLGMNSDHTVFDQLILDPDLTATVPRNQYFYSGMDSYIHCIESLSGHYRNAIGDAFSDQSLKLCREVFQDSSAQSDGNRAKLMVASYLGGCAIATSYVGIIHPFSAGLSVVLGVHHCLANCITIKAMAEFYPREVEEFLKFVDFQSIQIPEGICKNLSSDQYERLYQSTIIHEKPLMNALGEDFKNILTQEKVIEIFNRM